MAASAEDVPEMRDVLFVDAESGDLSLSNRPELDVIQINTYSQFARIHEFLRRHVQLRDADDEEGLKALYEKVVPGYVGPTRRYRTVIVDSLAEVFKYCMYGLTGVRIGQQILDVEPQQARFEEWGKATEMIRLMARSFRDLPMHIVFVSSEKLTEDDAKRAKIGLNLPKALAAELPGFFDVVGYLAVAAKEGHIQRRFYLETGNKFLAKNRFVNFKDPYIEEPSMEKMMALVREKPTKPPTKAG